MDNTMKRWLGALGAIVTATIAGLLVLYIWEHVKPQPNGTLKPSEPFSKSGPEDTQYAPGWVVELRTATMKDGRLTADPGNVAAYIEPGPLFEQGTFNKRAYLEGSPQIVVGAASSKFVARSAGKYQIGLRIEAQHPWAECSEKLSLNGTTLIERDAKGSGTIAAVSPLQLSAGRYDATLDFGCRWNDGPVPRQSGFGKVMILVARPDEIGPVPARPDDFMYHITGGSSKPNVIPTIKPRTPL
jgi:hypothetical protein